MSYEFCSRVRYSETDEQGRLSLSALVNYFQDVSTFQSEELGVGLACMQERDLAWVLSAWQIVIHRAPALGENVIVQTWPYEFHGFFGMRNFTLLDENREYLARANSVWTLIDVKRQRPVRCPQDIMEKYPMEPALEMEYASRKVELPEEGRGEPSFLIEKQMLDTNHHVNNGQYIAMAGAYLPEGCSVTQIRAEYKNQARLHDVICPMVYRREGQITVALCSEEGQPYAVVEFLTDPAR